MKKIAITGGIGSGKSTVLNLIKMQGFPIFSCDEIYKDVVKSIEYIQKIAETFPTVVKDGNIDKQILSSLIFNDASKRELLNQIAHPLIMKKLFDEMDLSNSDFVFAEVPLLFEGDFENLFDAVIVVKRDRKSRVSAVAARDHLAKIDVENRISVQFAYDTPDGMTRIKNCNAYVLENKDSINNLSNKLNVILQKIIRS